MGMTTLSVKERTAERFHDLKADLDEVQEAENHTVDSFMQALLDTWDAAGDGFYENDEKVDTDLLLGEIADLRSELPKDVADELEGRLR